MYPVRGFRSYMPLRHRRDQRHHQAKTWSTGGRLNRQYAQNLEQRCFTLSDYRPVGTSLGHVSHREFNSFLLPRHPLCQTTRKPKTNWQCHTSDHGPQLPQRPPVPLQICSQPYLSLWPSPRNGPPLPVRVCNLRQRTCHFSRDE